MSIRVQKLFEAIFTLEDMREIYRGSIPTGLDTVEETAFDEKIAELKAIISELEGDSGTAYITKIADSIPIRSREEEFINIQPIQAAGRLTPEAR